MGHGTLFDPAPSAGPKVRGIEIIVPGRPVAWKRPHFFAQLASGEKLWQAAKQAKTPQELRQILKPLALAKVMPHKDEPIADYQKNVRSAAYRIFQGMPWECPISLDILFLMPRPQKSVWKSKPMPRYPHTAKPDVDNLTKGIKDALNGVVYRDDSQVANIHSSKWVCAGGENPKTIIKLSKIESS